MTDRLAKWKIARYGWVPDIPDHRDFAYAVPRAVATKLPAKIDLRKACPAVYDQGQIGSCTANAIGAAIQFDRMKQKIAGARTAVPSRLFIYYNERTIEHTIGQDAGAMIRDGIKTAHKQGACFETGADAWPYAIGRFAEKPPAGCYVMAGWNQIASYSRIAQSLARMKGCLAAGYPFVFGFSVYDSFESAAVAKTGIVPIPQRGEPLLGGHAVMAVGYDDAAQRFLVRNSWGKGWGLKGYFTMPYAYLTDGDLADDFWTIRLVEAPG